MKKIILMLSLIILAYGCAEKIEKPANSSQIANPASVNCAEKGGTLKIVDREGGQYGICTLQDGAECEEWAYFRGECPKET